MSRKTVGGSTHVSDFDLSDTTVILLETTVWDSQNITNEGYRALPVRAVGGAHFAPPTHRTRRAGLDHGRSVPLSVALGGSDYALVPPACAVQPHRPLLHIDSLTL